jgi:ABC-type Fe3+/spermidine/putrescine transport system ATPase subunit
MSYLEIKNLTKKYGDFTAVESIDLNIEKGEMIALLGGSGCGKTTILKMIAGFTEPSAGTISINGNVVNALPPYKRNVGIFFQNYALFPHMSVFDNVAFSLKLKKLKKAEIQEKVSYILGLVKLEGKEGRYPRQLSGGQQQRVALARALVMEPDVLLLDEPLSNLDAKLRQDMQMEIKRIQKELGLTTIIVTHDQEEAISLANRVVIMNAGQILQEDAPTDVFNCPADPFIADFMGFSNFLTGMVEAASDGCFQLNLGNSNIIKLTDRNDAAILSDGDKVEIAIRPENVLLSASAQEGFIKGTIISSTYKGHHTLLEISSNLPGNVSVTLTDIDVPKEGNETYFAFPSEKVIIYKH